MTTVPYENFLPEVLPFVHNCPQDYAVNAIKNACIDFCNQTHWLQYTTDPMLVLANVTNYDLDYETGVLPIRLITLQLNGMNVPGTLGSDYTITLGVTPSTQMANALVATLALAPARSSTAIDVSVYERWLEVIAQGARGRLYDVPAQPFTDPQRATLAKGFFKSGIADARAEVQRGLTVGPISVQMRRV